MQTTIRFGAAATVLALLAGCALTGAPTQSAYSRNVGTGSSVLGTARSDLGSSNSGNTVVPGVPAAGGIGGNGGGN